MNGLEAYEPAFVPVEGRGLYNTGTICHENSLLQALVSCSAVVRAALANREYLAKTATGRAFHDFVLAAIPVQTNQPFAPRLSYEESSERVLAAVVSDLRRRRPSVQYGSNQESASEGLVLFLDMIDVPGGGVNPIARLFYHRYTAEVFCKSCAARVSDASDASVSFNLFAYDLENPTPRAFGDAIRRYETPLDGYRCERCKKTAGVRRYQLRLVPEVVVCIFNVYGARIARAFPGQILFPGIGGREFRFRQVAQIEHFGGRDSGHYCARALRGDGNVYQFDDLSVGLSTFGPTPNVYMVFYHFCAVL